MFPKRFHFRRGLFPVFTSPEIVAFERFSMFYGFTFLNQWRSVFLIVTIFFEISDGMKDQTSFIKHNNDNECRVLIRKFFYSRNVCYSYNVRDVFYVNVFVKTV